jgi:hypothetical protein
MKTMDLYREEREAGPWRIEPLTVLRSLVLDAWQPPPPAIVAIDGRSSSGKTTLAEKFRRVTEGAAVVHTDDIPLLADMAFSYIDWNWPEAGVRHLLQPCLLHPRHGVSSPREELSIPDWVRAMFAFGEKNRPQRHP